MERTYSLDDRSESRSISDESPSWISGSRSTFGGGPREDSSGTSSKSRTRSIECAAVEVKIIDAELIGYDYIVVLVVGSC